MRRSGYTLLEVLLASAIAVIMMGALYTAIQVQIRQMDEGRNRVERTALARAIFHRMTQDIAPSLAPVAPVISSSSTSQSSSMTPAAEDTTTTVSALNFQIGVRGSDSQVSIYLTRLNRATVTPVDDGRGNIAVGCDIRRISYFLSPDRGLARQEIRAVTSEDVDSEPVDVDDYSKVLASEVTEFTVSYFDGTAWVDSWEGSDPGPDGTTPMGPPRAVKITITIRLADDEEPKSFTHVIAFPAAPGAPTETE